VEEGSEYYSEACRGGRGGLRLRLSLRVGGQGAYGGGYAGGGGGGGYFANGHWHDAYGRPIGNGFNYGYNSSSSSSYGYGNGYGGYGYGRN
jgi:hypothetical protein